MYGTGATYYLSLPRPTPQLETAYIPPSVPSPVSSVASTPRAFCFPSSEKQYVFLLLPRIFFFSYTVPGTISTIVGRIHSKVYNWLTMPLLLPLRLLSFCKARTYTEQAFITVSSVWEQRDNVICTSLKKRRMYMVPWGPSPCGRSCQDMFMYTSIMRASNQNREQSRGRDAGSHTSTNKRVHIQYDSTTTVIVSTRSTVNNFIEHRIILVSYL